MPRADTTAPSKPTIDEVYDDVGSIQGPVAKGGVTDDPCPTLSGKAEAGSKVTVYDNNKVLGSVTADNEGHWSYTPTTPLNEGPHDFTVDATDKAGNTSLKSDVFSIITDYTPPAAPLITGVLDSVGEVTGNIESGGITDDPRPVISGKGTAGDTLIVYTHDVTGDREIGRTTVGADGTWKLQPTTPLVSGLNQLTAVEMDPAGNTSVPSAKYSFTLDIAPPAPPVIENVLDDVGPYTGFLQKGAITDDNQPTFSGTAQAGSTVKLYDTDGTLIGSGQADAKGHWSITTSTLADGLHEVTATATDGVGKVSDPTGIWPFTVDTTAPANTTLVVTDNVGDETGPLHNGDTTDDNRPVFTGDAEPNGKVILYDNGNELGRADVDAQGKWSFIPTTALKDGDHSFTTVVLDQAGNSSGPGNKLDVTVDTSKLLVSITSVVDNVGSITGNITSGGETDDTRPVINGTGKVGSTVTVKDGETTLGT
ncbi:Ig-like domain-containing protein [Pseudomonas sp. NY15437]|uniref:Ig-like domain-containing protein n=1 Tax=Pseudomonas sp. NY15437 TaxID=3400360 RepID=UPI003A8B07F9